jgi:hypothetical protein
MSDAEPPQVSQHLHTEMDRSKTPRERTFRGRDCPDSPNGSTHNSWSELQELRSKMMHHEETMDKLKVALGALSSALDTSAPEPHGYYGNNESPANRPPRMNRRGGANGNTSHYKTNNRGGGSTGGYRNYRGGASSFRSG